MNVHYRSTRIMLAGTLLFLIGSVMAVQQIKAHGSMRVPLSREYNCFLEGPENPQSEACKAAIAEAGTQQFYDWNGINRMDANDRHREIVPDGELCSGGKESHRGLNLARNDWVTQVVSPRADGTFEFVYEASVPHSTRYFEFYVTKDGYDPIEPLKWSDLEDEPFRYITEVELENGQYRMNCPMPLEKVGKHIIYNIWQRNDSQEAFYSCIDVTFDYSGVVATPTAAPPTATPLPTTDPSEWACQVDYEITADWGAGFNAEVTVTNLSETTIDGWTVSWDFSGEQVVSEAWNGSFQQAGQSVAIRNVEWNRSITSGASVNMGIGANYQGRNEMPVNFALNGEACNGQAPPSSPSPTLPPTFSPTPSPTVSPTVVNSTETPTAISTTETPIASHTPIVTATTPVPSPTTQPPDPGSACSAPNHRSNLKHGGLLIYLPITRHDASNPPTPNPETTVSCSIDYRVVSDWESGFVGNIIITNRGDEDIRGYELKWTFANGEVIDYGWNAVFDQTGESVVACNVAEQTSGVIVANGRNPITIGFMANHNGQTSVPNSFTLNGTVCSVTGSMAFLTRFYRSDGAGIARGWHR